MRSATTTEHVATTGSSAICQPTMPSAAIPSSADLDRAHSTHAAAHGEHPDRATRQHLPDREREAPGRPARPLRRKHDERERRPDRPGGSLRRGRSAQDVADVGQAGNELQDPREHSEDRNHGLDRRAGPRPTRRARVRCRGTSGRSGGGGPASGGGPGRRGPAPHPRRARRGRRCGTRCRGSPAVQAVAPMGRQRAWGMRFPRPSSGYVDGRSSDARPRDVIAST